MKSETVSKAYRGHTHVYSQPKIYHPYIDAQFSPVYQIKTNDINEGCGNTEIYKEALESILKESPDDPIYSSLKVKSRPRRNSSIHLNLFIIIISR